MILMVPVFCAAIGVDAGRSEGAAGDPRPVMLERLARELTDAHRRAELRFAGSSRFVFRASTPTGMQLFSGESGPAAGNVQLTDLPKPVGGYVVTPGGREVAYLSDPEGKNQAGLYLAPVPGGAPKTLAPSGVATRYGPLTSPGAPRHVFTWGRRHDQPGLVVERTDIEGSGGPEVVLSLPELNGFVVGIDPAATRALVGKFVSFSDVPLIIVDMSSRATVRAFPPTGSTGRIADAAFSKDAKRLFAVGQVGDDLLLTVVQVGGEWPTQRQRTIGGRDPVVGVVLEDGDRGRTLLRTGDGSAVLVVDAQTLTTKRWVQLPGGTSEATELSPDGAVLSVQWSSPEDPGDALIIDLESGAVRRMPDPVRSRAVPVRGRIEKIPSFDGLDIPVNVYLPAGPQGRLPVMVMLHGGPPAQSNFEWSARNQFFLANGYAVVEPNIRGSSGLGRAYQMADDGPKRPDSFRDLAAVGRWVSTQPWADSQRLFLMGGSYGGYLVLVGLTVQPELWRAGVDLYGISDWRSFFATTNASTAQVFETEVGSPTRDAAFLDEISPLRHVDRARAPLFVYHGKGDMQVPLGQSEAIVAAWRGRSLPVEFMTSDAEGHGPAAPDTLAKLWTRALLFVETAASETAKSMRADRTP